MTSTDKQDFYLLYFIFKQNNKDIHSILARFNSYPETTFDTEKRIDELISKNFLEKTNNKLSLTLYGCIAVKDFILANPISFRAPFLNRTNTEFALRVFGAISVILSAAISAYACLFP